MRGLTEVTNSKKNNDPYCDLRTQNVAKNWKSTEKILTIKAICARSKMRASALEKICGTSVEVSSLKLKVNRPWMMRTIKTEVW